MYTYTHPAAPAPEIIQKLSVNA